MAKKKRTILGPLGDLLPGDPTEIIESIKEVVDNLSNLKSVPKDLMEKVVEADRDFRETDKALRSTRIRGKRKS